MNAVQKEELVQKGVGTDALKFIEDIFESERKEIRKEEKDIHKKIKDLERLNKLQTQTQKKMLLVIKELEEAKDIIEIEKIKDEAMLSSIGDGVFAVDQNGKFMLINKKAKELFEMEDKELLGVKTPYDIQLEDQDGHVITRESRPTYLALTSGKVISSSSYVIVREDGTKFPISLTVTPIRNFKGEIIGAIDIFRDITQEKEIDQAKSEFVSLASHQLRTPLGIIKWYIEAMQEKANFDEVTQGYLNEIYKGNERLLALVRDLLSISRIDQGKVRNDPSAVDIAGVIRVVINEMKILAIKSNIGISFEEKDKLQPIFIDQLRFQEVMENLLTNSIKYNIANGKVEIILTKNDENFIVAIKDTGIGITNEDKKNLFTKFFRSQNAIISNPEGSGLGLYVAKSYVNSWKGKIEVESEEGKGSTFTVILPIVGK